MVSKGVDYYAYIPAGTRFCVQFSKSTSSGAKTTYVADQGGMFAGNLQINSSDLQGLSVYGDFSFKVKNGRTAAVARQAEINPYTGNLGDSDLGTMLDTPSVLTEAITVCYGFFDSGSGIGSALTNQDQSYVYVTRSHRNWMGDLVKAHPAVAQKYLRQFALPGAHDAGMFDTAKVFALVGNDDFQDRLLALLGLPGSYTLVVTRALLKRMAVNLAFTQKDLISTMLGVGIRYLDFRPGYLVSPLNDGKLYHQHNFIPGVSYTKFLEGVLNWLDKNPTEIVVVSLNFQGFASDSQQPSHETLAQYLGKAMKSTKTNGRIEVGDKSSLDVSYRSLIEQKKRLVFLNQVGQASDATKYDSYSSKYKTTDPQKIISALNGMKESRQASNDYTVLQLQGTAQALFSGLASGIFTLSDASSPLMSTKAKFDHVTYPWLLSHAAYNLDPERFLVFLNDFADNALVEMAIQVTKQRMRVGAQRLLRNTLSSGQADVSFVYGRSGSIPIVGDWTGTGKDTPGVVVGRTWRLRNSNDEGPAVIEFTYGEEGDIPIVGDWDGDGKDSPGVIRHGNQWLLRNCNSAGPAEISFTYGEEGDIPIVGDWNGDGKDTPGLYRKGKWMLRNQNSAGAADLVFGFGRAADAPVVGDWTGQGKDTVGVVRNGRRWFLRYANSGGVHDFAFDYGTVGDLPMPGDWTGNGKDTPGVVR